MSSQSDMNSGEVGAQVAAFHMILVALIMSHPDPAGFAKSLRLLTGEIQVEGAAQGIPLPPRVREMLGIYLRQADSETESRE